jgi:hypothetical protein
MFRLQAMRYLTTESLRHLDQAPALKEPEYVIVLSYIATLKSLEKKIFLKCLDKENSRIYKAYLKIEEEINKEKEQREFLKREKRKKAKEKKEKAFSKIWTTEKIENEAKKLAPNLCGLLFDHDDDRYFKHMDFSSSLRILFDYLNFVYHPYAGLSFTLKEFYNLLKKLKTGEALLLNDYRIYFSEESRDRYLFHRSESEKEEKKKRLAEGYTFIEG